MRYGCLHESKNYLIGGGRQMAQKNKGLIITTLSKRNAKKKDSFMLSKRAFAMLDSSTKFEFECTKLMPIR